MQFKKNYFKYILAWAGVFLVRLLPFRAPNVEPVMSAAMPFAKQYGKLSGFLFGFLSIALYDAATNRVGWWTLTTAASYGAVGIGAAWFLKRRAATALNFVTYAIPTTILYDAATGLTMGPLFFHQPFVAALVGQIPFTLLHLTGNIAFALFLSPALYRFVVMNRSLEVGLVGEKAVSPASA